MRARSRLAAVTAVGATILLAACSAGTDSAVTVTSATTISASGGAGPGASAPGRTSGSRAGSTTGGTGRPSPVGTSSGTHPGSTSASGSSAGTSGSSGALPAGAMPDGFVPTKLKPGQKAPQFVIVSFDGVGWHDKWSYWKSIEDKVPFHFTGFLSGTYMLSDATKTKYTGPGHAPGKASIGWNAPSDLPVEIADLNDALNRGDEVGTHFNGHFCASAGATPGGDDWKDYDWNNELDQFFGLVRNVDANNGIPDRLNLPAAEVRGERTPCLEGHLNDLFPALKSHGFAYDSSFTRHGISWPTKDPKYGIWQIGMAEFPIHGTLPAGSPVDSARRTNHFQITMDYNFYYSQRGASSKGVSTDDSATDSEQVLDTYRDMYRATFNGNRAPLILGNHFNSWNNNAYSDAIGNFVTETCGKPDTYCVPFRDLVAWMNMQDPARLAQLQGQDPETQAG